MLRQLKAVLSRGFFSEVYTGGCCCSDTMDPVTTNILFSHLMMAKGLGTRSEGWMIMFQMKGDTVCFKQMEIPKLMFETNLG